jgi:hypothetical protein
MYTVYDYQTSAKIGKYQTLKAACRAAEKRNMEYGGHRYDARPVVQ